MIRRNLFKAALLNTIGLMVQPPAETVPGLGTTVLAVSIFGGQGSEKNIDTGLRYQGRKVSPSWVSITPQGFGVKAEVGVNPHQSDTNIDVQVSGGVAWAGLAFYIQ